MGRKARQVTLPGYAWCSKGEHELPFSAFYKRWDGTCRPWCIECTKKYTKDKGQVNELLKKPDIAAALCTIRANSIPDEDWEEKEFKREQTLLRKEWQAPPYAELVLDWLTPIYAFEKRLSTPSVELDRITPEG